MKQPYVLHYWGIKARGYLPALIAKVGGFPMEWDKTPDWPAIKPRSPTGQLPFMEGPNGLCIGQSGAIVRFIARKTGLDGATDEEFAMSEQLIQQAEDLYTCLAKAHYAGGGARRTEEMDAFYGHVLPPLLDVLERMIPCERTRGSDSLSSTSTSDPRGREPVKIDNTNSRSKRERSPVVTIESLQEEDVHAHTFTGRVLAGDLAVYVALDLLVSLQADCLSQHPTLLNFYLGLNRIEKIREVGSPLQPYFRRYSDPRSGDVLPTLRPNSPPFVFNTNINSSAHSRTPRASSSSTSSTRECSISPTRKLEIDLLTPPKPSSPRHHTHSLSSSHQISPTAGRFAPSMAGDDLQYHSPSSHHNNHSREARLLRSSSERDRERHHRPHHSNSRSRSNSRARDHGGEHAEPSEMSGDSPRLKEKCDLNVHISSAPSVAPDRLRRSHNQHHKSDAADAILPSSKSMELIVLDGAKTQVSAPTLSVVRSKSGGKDKEKEKI